MIKETFKFTPNGEIDVTKAKIEGVVIKPVKEVSMKLRDPSYTAKFKEVDLKLKKASYPGKIKVVDNLFEGSL